jgi:hypothetical protein
VVEESGRICSNLWNEERGKVDPSQGGRRMDHGVEQERRGGGGGQTGSRGRCW